MFSLTNLFGKAMTYLVIALWKLEKPIVRKAPSGSFVIYTNKILNHRYRIIFAKNMAICSQTI